MKKVEKKLDKLRFVEKKIVFSNNLFSSKTMTNELQVIKHLLLTRDQPHSRAFGMPAKKKRKEIESEK